MLKRKEKARPANGDQLIAGDRRQKVLMESARLFATGGYDGTSVRDIAAATGIMPSSLYHHFNSKEAIFMAVHTAGMELLLGALLEAIEGVEDPWDRLEAAAAATCKTLLETRHLTIIVNPRFASLDAEHRRELIRQRDGYERIVAGLVAELPLADDIDRKLFRLHFLGALNWTQTWYRPDSDVEPAEIGRQLVRMLRK